MFSALKHSFWKNFFTPGTVYPAQLAFLLLLPIRKLILSPKKLMQYLVLKETDHVLEIGPGPGFFSVTIAQSLLRGRLTLFDIQEKMLAIARKRLEKKKLTNVIYQLADGNSLPFIDAAFDVVVMVTVLGEIEHQSVYLHEIHRVLNTDGCLSISEQAGDVDQLSVAEVIKLVTNFGFLHKATYKSCLSWTVNFKKIH